MFEYLSHEVKLCISIAKYPGLIGFNLHNYGYYLNKLDYLYLPLQVDNLNEILVAARNFKVIGMSVSMPYKNEILKYIDVIEEKAKKIEAVNTILFRNNQLYGFNTDYDSVRINLKSINKNNLSKVLILGHGGMARVFREALCDLGSSEIYYWSRTENKEFSKKAIFIGSNGVNKFTNVHTLINATPMGMKGIPNIINLDSYKKLTTVIDSVSRPIETKLIIDAKKKGLDTIFGAQLAFDQFLRQFSIYTQTDLPRSEIKKYYEKLIGTEIK
jgi:shikimate dehydrogenase